MEVVEDSASAAKYLCAWGLSMNKFLTNYIRVKPQLVALEHLKSGFEKNVSEMKGLEAELSELNGEIEALNKKKRQSEVEKMDIVFQKANILRKIERVKQLLELLKPHNTQWEESFKKLENKAEIILGNSLLSAACIEYSGILDKPLRKKLSSQLQKILAKSKVKSSLDFKLHKFIGNKQEIYAWRLAGLPPSNLNLENATILQQRGRAKVVFDPNDTCLAWLTNLAKRNQKQVLFSSLADKSLVVKLQTCLEKGHLIVIDFFNGDLTGIVSNLLSPVVRMVEGQQTIKIEDMWYNFDSNFDFYLLTRDRDAFRKPEVQAKCRTVRFSLDDEGLEKSIKACVTEIYNPKEEREKFERENQLLQRKSSLFEVQESILKKLVLNSDEVILADEDYVEMLENFEVLKENLQKDMIGGGEEGLQEIGSGEEDQRSPINHLYKTLIELFKIFQRFSQVESYLNFSANAYLKVVSHVISDLGLSSADEFTKETVLIVASRVFNVLAGGATSETRLFVLVDLCVSILKIYNEFKQDIWEYVINSNNETQAGEGSEPEVVEKSVWKTLQKLRVLIPSIEMEHLPGYVQIFQQVHSLGMKGVLKAAMQKASHLISLEKLALCICFVPDNFHLCLATFAEDVLPEVLVEAPSLDRTLSLSKIDQPIIFIQSGLCDYAQVLEKISSKFETQSQLVYCGNSSWDSIVHNLEKALSEGQILLLSEFGLIPEIHEGTSRFLREISSKPKANPKFKVILGTTTEEGNLSIELVNMALKVFEQQNETPMNFQSFIEELSVEMVEKVTLNLMNMTINIMLAYAVINARARFGDQGTSV